MAIYSLHISNVSRAKGSSSCATLSYITGQKIYEERTGETYSYGRRERVVTWGVILPNQAPEEFRNPEKLFNSIENFEKADNARTAKKIMAALPREFSPERQKKVLEEYIRENITKEGYACAYAIHTDKENRNPHAHILIANRQLNQKGEWGSKRKMEYVLDEKGARIPQIDKKTGLQKTDSHGRKQWKRVNREVNPLDKEETLRKLREQWAVSCNRHLSPKSQIDHRSYAEREIEQLPTIHEGYAAQKIEERGGVSDRCSENREIRSLNAAGLLQEIRKEWERLVAALQKLIERKQEQEMAKEISFPDDPVKIVHLLLPYRKEMHRLERIANYEERPEYARTAGKLKEIQKRLEACRETRDLAIRKRDSISSLNPFRRQERKRYDEQSTEQLREIRRLEDGLRKAGIEPENLGDAIAEYAQKTKEDEEMKKSASEAKEALKKASEAFYGHLGAVSEKYREEVDLWLSSYSDDGKMSSFKALQKATKKTAERENAERKNESFKYRDRGRGDGDER